MKLNSFLYILLLPVILLYNGVAHAQYATSAPGAIIIPLGDTVLCTGGYVALTANTAPGLTYQWTIDGKPIAGATTADYVAKSAGLYGVTITNTTGGTSVAVIHVSVSPVSAIITETGSSVFCGNVGDRMYADSAVPGISYQWLYNGTGIAGATDATYTATHTGSYWLCESNSAGCIVASDTVNIKEFPLPAPIIAFDSGVLYTQNYFASYQWLDNSKIITGATSYELHAPPDGYFSVEVTDTNGCKSVSDMYAHTLPLNTATANNTINVRIYPNPTHKYVNIDGGSTNLRGIMMDAEGRTIADITDVHTIDVSVFADGVYLLSLYGTDGSKVKEVKIVKTTN